MISWGTKYDHVGELNDFAPEKCQICNETNASIYRVEQGYFSLYGLSLFPTSRKYFKICPSCKSRLKVRSTDENLGYLKRNINVGLKFKYIWGWLVVGPILAGIIFFLIWAKTQY
jgi:hypothetical protein